MEYILLQGEDAETVYNYIPESVLEGFRNNKSRYALCATETDRVIGVGVFDAYPEAHVLSIRSVKKNRLETDRELLSNILKICENLGCEGAYYEIYYEDDHEYWEPLLYEAGFSWQDQNELYKIPISDLEFNADLNRTRVSSHIISLGEAYPTAINAYGNRLNNSESFDKFTTGDFDKELSSLYVNEDGEIEACLLISDQGAKVGFTIEYVNTEDCNDSTALLQLLKHSSENIFGRYTSDQLSGYALAVNPEADDMIRKGFPHAEVVDHCVVYVKLF